MDNKPLINPVLNLGGHRFWYNSDDELHREDGPAAIHANGRKFWYLHNNIYSFDDYCKKLNLSDEDKLFIILKNGF